MPQAPNLKVLMDLYHCQIAEEVTWRPSCAITYPRGRITIFKIAGVPERHEPDRGELHYPYLFDLLDAWAVCWVGCEYRPAVGSRRPAWLGWRYAGLRKGILSIDRGRFSIKESIARAVLCVGVVLRMTTFWRFLHGHICCP